MKHYLVTGGAGCIGARLVERLLQSGHAVTVLDDLSRGKKSAIPPHRHLLWIVRHLLHTGSEEIPERLDGIVHLAAHHPGGSGLHPDSMRQHQANLSATLRLLLLAREKQVPRVVFASTALLNLQNPPLHPLVIQKRAAEEYGGLFGTGFASFRLPLVTGPGMRMDELHQAWQKDFPAREVGAVVEDFCRVLQHPLLPAGRIFDSAGSMVSHPQGVGLSLSAG